MPRKDVQEVSGLILKNILMEAPSFFVAFTHRRTLTGKIAWHVGRHITLTVVAKIFNGGLGTHCRLIAECRSKGNCRRKGRPLHVHNSTFFMRQLAVMTILVERAAPVFTLAVDQFVSILIRLKRTINVKLGRVALARLANCRAQEKHANLASLSNQSRRDCRLQDLPVSGSQVSGFKRRPTNFSSL